MTATIIDNVRVFDGTGLTEPRSVALDGGLIVETAAPGARTVDGGGGALLPGLIDTHVHVETLAELETYSRWGVTTALDMAAPRPDKTFALRHTPGVADLFTAGYPAVAPGAIAITKMGYPAEIGVTGPLDAERFVADRIRDGVDYFKILVDDPKQPGTKALPPQTVTALVRAAHDRGLMVIAHVTSDTTYRIAVDAGADIVTHVPMQSVLSGDLRREGVIVSPTLVMMRGICEILGRKPLLRILSTVRIVPRLDYANARASVRRLHEAGVPILAGSDANADPAAPFSPPHGESLHTELGLLVDAGLSPLEALRSATSRAADAFGLTDRGAVEAGRRADLLLVDGDPTTDIQATRRVRHVWAGGTQVR